MPKSFLNQSYNDLVNQFADIDPNPSSFDPLLPKALPALPKALPGFLRPIPLSKTDLDRVISLNQIPQIFPLIGHDSKLKLKNLYGKGRCAVIIDTGVDANHPDLKDAVKLSVNCSENPGDVNDLQGHGTFMAGIIAGRSSQHEIRGIAPEANIISMKITKDASDEATWWSIDNALKKTIDLAQDSKSEEKYGRISVVNLSFNASDNVSKPSCFMYHSLVQKIEYLNGLNIPVVVSVGNGFRNFKEEDGVAYPAYSDKVIAVGAFDDSESTGLPDALSSFSQRAPFDWDQINYVSSPAFAVSCSPFESGYAPLMGTSVSAAIVSGMVLLMRESCGLHFTNDRLRTALKNGSDWIERGPRKYRKTMLNKAITQL